MELTRGHILIIGCVAFIIGCIGVFVSWQFKSIIGIFVGALTALIAIVMTADILQKS